MTRDDELIIICALRYAFGRNTYMPSIVADYIWHNIENYSDKFIEDIIRNIEDETKSHIRLECRYDEKTWRDLLTKLHKNMHKHIFKQTGGGCSYKGECDMSYECSCGEKIRIATGLIGYWNLPLEFKERGDLTETERLEREGILKMITGESIK